MQPTELGGELRQSHLVAAVEGEGTVDGEGRVDREGTVDLVVVDNSRKTVSGRAEIVAGEEDSFRSHYT